MSLNYALSLHSVSPSLRGFLLKAQQVIMEIFMVCFQKPMPTFAFNGTQQCPVVFSEGAVSSLWPLMMGWPDLACVACVVPTRVHLPSYSAWLTQTTLD